MQEVTALQVLLALFNKKAMPKYSTEIRQAPKEQYIKVFLADNSEMQDAKEWLELVHSVRKVNVSNDRYCFEVGYLCKYSTSKMCER